MSIGESFHRRIGSLARERNRACLFYTSFSAKEIPVARVGQPEDIAATVSFRTSDEAGFVNGQVIYVAGGPKD